MTESNPPAALVACLCAQWCGSCRDYVTTFQAMRQRFAQARFLWIDVEDESDLVDPVEVDNFPTLLIAAHGQARFFGPLTPQPETLERLLLARLADDAPALPGQDPAHALLQRIASAHGG